MKDFVIYTVMVGEYDEIRQPLVVDERFDYILFTDHPDINKVGVWESRIIEMSYPNDLFKLSRRPKILPMPYLSEYKASLYLDANVQITTSHVYDRFMQLYTSDIEWGAIKHPYNTDCIYGEIVDILRANWVHDYEVINWYGILRKSGFPEHYGMYENNVIYRRHTKNVADVCQQWWETIEDGCRRDQFSLMYLLWKSNVVRAYLLDEYECPRTNSRNFRYYGHSKDRSIHVGFHEIVRNRCARVADPNRSGYPYLLDKLSKYHNPKVMLYLWEVFAIFVYGPQTIISMIKRKYKK